MVEPAYRGVCALINEYSAARPSNQGKIMKCNKMNRNLMPATAAFIGTLLLAVTTFSGNSARADDAVDTVATPLKLINGWTSGPFGTGNAAVQIFGGFVHLKGAIASGTSVEPFKLPVGFRPAKQVFLPVDLCGAANGSLNIYPDGTVYLAAEKTFTDAQCFTSLDGVSFAPNGTGFTTLTLINGWAHDSSYTYTPGVKKFNGIVHFKGGIYLGTKAQPFVLPIGFRPATTVYVPVILQASSPGRLIIEPSGVVTVQGEHGFTDAHDFTSLDGAWFVASNTGYTNLTLINGWNDTKFNTANPAANSGNDTLPVYFKGAIETGGTNPVPFTLPVADRPVKNVYVPIDLCNATKGRLYIQPSGVVTVQAETSFGNAQCFTSLDGASFVQ
jgi:hypothetical protein